MEAEFSVSNDIEVTCPRCHQPRLPGAFYLYQEHEDAQGRFIRRRHVANCLICRANELVTANKMPDEFAVPESIDGVWDYTAAYRKYQAKLAEDYNLTIAKRSLRPAAEAAAFVRRAREIVAHPSELELRRRVLEGTAHEEEFAARTYEWLLMNDVCTGCGKVKHSREFIARKKRGRGYRYEFKSWCEECRGRCILPGAAK